jgi:hypothetical protein
MRRDLFEDFCRNYVRELIQAIEEGVSALSIKDERLSLEAAKAELQSRLNARDARAPASARWNLSASNLKIT